jgi:hypothetical protein
MTRSLRKAALAAACLLWIGAVGLGSLAMLRYQSQAGGDQAAPAEWPAESQLPLDRQRPTLLLFAHPRCSCSRATLAELGRLLAQSQDRWRTHVLFYVPEQEAESFAATDLWERAARIPGVELHIDRGGSEAQRFHGQTSGHVALYSPQGQRIFDGGITVARGHEGTSRGQDALLALLQGKPAATNHAVYGCAIHPTNK